MPPKDQPRGKIIRSDAKKETVTPATVTPATETVTTNPVVVTPGNKVPLQPVINNKTTSQTLIEKMIGGSYNPMDYLKRTKDEKATINANSKKTNWDIKDPSYGVSYDDVFNSMTDRIVEQNKNEDPNIKEELFRHNKAAKQVVNSELKSYITELKGTSLEKPLTNFSLQSDNYSKSAREVYVLNKKLIAAQETFNLNKTQKNADDANNVLRQYNEQFKLYADYSSLYNSSKQTLVEQANKSGGKLVYYNDKFYNSIDYRKKNENPVVPNVTSAFSTSTELVTEGNTIKTFYDGTDTGAAFEMVGDIETTSRKEINNLRDPVLKSFYEKAFESYDTSNKAMAMDNIDTIAMFEKLLESVEKHGTTENQKQNTFKAKLMLHALRNTGSVNGQAELFNNSKKGALELIDVLGDEQKNQLFKIAKGYVGDRSSYYPGSTDDAQDIYFTKTKGLENKIKAFDDFLKFKEDLSDLAIEKLVVGYQDIPILNGKNKASQEQTKKLYENFVNSKTGQFVEEEAWTLDKKGTLEAVFRAQQGTEVALAGNIALDAAGYAFDFATSPSKWFRPLGAANPQTVSEYFSKESALANVSGYYKAKNSEIYQDVKKQYKKIYDQLELTNLANYSKSTIGQLGNYRNMPIEYVGLDLTLMPGKDMLKANDENEPSSKHDNANKIINLLKNTNGEWISDAEGQDIEVLSETNLNELGEYSLTKKKLSLFKETNQNLNDFFKENNNNVTLRFYRNTAIPDKARYDFIQNEGAKDQKKISVLIPYTKLDDEDSGIAENLFIGTKLTPEEFNFKLNGDRTTFSKYKDEQTGDYKYTEATMKKTTEFGSQVYKLEITFLDNNGNLSTIRETIENASVISSTDATNQFNDFLKNITHAELVEQAQSNKRDLQLPN